MKFLRMITGVLLMLGGLASVVASVLQISKGQWPWLLITILGSAVGLIGFRIARGDKIRDILDDFLIGVPLP